MKVKALEDDTVDSLCFRTTHDAGRHRKGAGCQPRTLSAGISGRRAGVEMPEPEKKKREMIQLWGE
ncbi:Tail protein X (GpX) [Escherichia coli]|uniref:Tail protein X (GpX) n=1 Tax=Escherichia coli TaxID=562 RepID=A0A3S4KUE8_ECOLX|nr:Tail protein X (GpX) [Escherichia coli]